MRKTLDYLGFTSQGSTNLASGGIKPSNKKNQAVTDWEILKNLRHVQYFQGFTKFYRRFLRDSSSIASPLYKPTEKGNTFHWFVEYNHAFWTLKKCLTTAPLLVTPRTGLNESSTPDLLKTEVLPSCCSTKLSTDVLKPLHYGTRT